LKQDFMHSSESVTEGHPDKMCDQISDAIVDRFLESDFRSRIIAECAVSLSVVFIAARFASRAKVDFPSVARKVIRKIGYTEHEFDFKTCSILTSLKEMAPDQDTLFNEDELTDEDI
jgi:S-adenosylmethionine synthetase